MVSWVLLDLDGVVYRGESLIAGSVEAIESLRRNFNVRFLTNNATKTGIEYAEKLTKMGIKTVESDVLTSGKATAIYMREKFGRLRIYPVGGSALRVELTEQGHILCDWDEAEAVVACLDFNFDYTKLANASNAIRRGAMLVATNRDPVVPVEEGFLPGAGSIVSAIETASGTRAISIGKPSQEMFSVASKLWNCRPEETIIVGDRLDTDIAFGNRLGITSILVLTGAITSWDPSVKRSPELTPARVFQDLKEVAQFLTKEKLI